MASSDVELGIPQEGYPALADWIAADPDSESFIFRKFGRLAARNLLMLQAQLFALEFEYDELEREMCNSTDLSQRESSRRWETFLKHSGDPGRPEARQLSLSVQVRNKLKEYHEALLLQSSIAELGRPRSRVLKIFRAWFSGKARSLAMPVIAGRARKMLDDEDDLVALHVPTEPDMLSRLVQDHWPLEVSNSSLYLPLDGGPYFRLRHVTAVVAIISTIVAAVELVGAIAGLYFAKNSATRMGMIAAFTLVFGLSLKLLTSARRAEIYASSAAYAAILVVFVSSNLS
ncbi:hypothetical protein GQ53DRAFT_857809 [Thozetella sp. PMI_491]|nr:hypothetical protein GQ53DRAFT_857809 [Thozetella sp. PMI_491]